MMAIAQSDAVPTVAPLRRRVRTWLIIATILGVPAIVIGAVFAMVSPMMFDAPGSTDNRQLVVLFWSVVSFPLVCAGSIITAWIAFAFRRERIALWLSLLPLLPAVTGAVVLFLWQ